jgi:hypothetical protein
MHRNLRVIIDRDHKNAQNRLQAHSRHLCNCGRGSTNWRPLTYRRCHQWITRTQARISDPTHQGPDAKSLPT